MHRKSKIDALGAFLLIIIMATLGLNQVAIKVVNEAIDPVMQAGLRSALAIPLIVGYMLFRKKRFELSPAILIPGILAGICFAIEFAMLFTAIQYTSVGRTTMFFYTMPFWVAIGAHFLIPEERMTVLKLSGLVLATIGISIALYSNGSSGWEQTLFGDIFAMLGAIFWAAIALLARTTRLSDASPEMQLLYQIFVSAILLVPLALFLGQGVNDPSLMHWTIFTTQIVLVVCVSFVVWFWVLSVYPASDMASFGFLAPLFGLIFGWLILGEPITQTILVSLAFVAAGIILVNRKPKT